jgi:hypothetical protein
MGLRPLDKTLKPPETLIFSALIEQAKAPMRSVASGSARYTIASGGELAMSEQTGNRRRPHPKERHFLPGSSAGVSVPKRIDDRGVQAMREFPYAA